MIAVAHPVRNALAGTLAVLILTGGVTTTWAVETPTAVVFDDISTHSITASAYAPTPAFSSLELGMSGTDIAIDGNYAAWHSPGNIWTAKAPMPTGRHQAAAAVVGGRIYVIGGPTGNSLTVTNVNQEYDPATNSWATKAPMPDVRLGLTAAAVGTKIYAMGGGTAFLVGLDTNYEYDVEANAWATKAPMPTGRQDHAAAALDGKIYAMGGNTLSGIVGVNEIYDPATDSWAAALSMPTPRSNFVAAAVNGGIYAIVGTSASNTYTPTNERYNPGTNSWATKAPAPAARYTHSGAVAGGKVFILAGSSATGDVSATDEYDPSADTWTTRAPIPTPRNNAVAAAVAGKVYVMGGSVGATVPSANEQYDPGVTTPFASLIPNTLYAFKAKARDAAGVETAESPTFSTYTLAATPANLAVAAVTSMTVSLTWSANGNPAGTAYELFRSTGGPFSLRSSQTTAFTTDSGLTPLTNYSYEVRAINGDFIATAFTAIVSTQTSVPAPAAPTGFAGTSLSPTSIRWTWADNASSESGYRVLSGTVNVSGDLAANTTTWLQTGLSTNTLHGPFLAQAFNTGGTSDSNIASRTTLATPPAGLAVTAVSSTSISLAWSAGGNPGGTVYELQRSTGGPFGFLSTGTAIAFTDTELTPLSAYQYQVRAFNGDSLATAFSNQVSTETSAPDAPDAPTVFSGTALSPTAIQWNWTDNADNEGGYRVLSGTVNVSGDLAANTTTWLQTGLSTNTIYGPFLVQAFNAGGTADSDTASRATLAAAPADLVVGGVSSTTVSLAWSANGNPGGTVYELFRSTGGPFTLRSSQTTAFTTDGDLTPLTLYQYQVRAINGDAVATAFSATVSTQTGAPPIETPTAVVFDDISTHSITASAYAPTPAFSNLELGMSGTDISIDGNYAAWHSPGNQWTAKTAMPTARYAPGLATVGGKIYAMGGNQSGPLNANDEYDPASNTWATKASMPTSRDTLAAVSVDGKVYAIGGAGNSVYFAVNEEYDPTSNTWTPKAPMPTVRYGLMAAVVGGRVYVVGGADFTSVHSANEEYDPQSNTWAIKAPMPTARRHPAGATVGAKIYVLGGNDNSIARNDNEAYDPSSNTWVVRAPMPTGRDSLAAAAVGGKLHALGGYNGSYLATNEEYDPGNNAWTTRATMPTTRYLVSAAAAGGRVYAMGGYNGTLLASNEEYDPGVTTPFAALTPNTLYAFKAKARDAAGVESAESPTFSTYTLAATPANLAVAAVTSMTVSLTWSANGNPAGTAYELFRSTGGPFSLRSTQTTAFTTDSGLTPLTNYSYEVRAINGDFIATAFTAIVSTQTTAPDAPETPSSFAGTAPATTELRWTWTDNTANESGYRVLSGTVNVSGDLAANTTTWLQAGLSTNTIYGPFLVQAFGAGGTADSNNASRTTLAAPPANLDVMAVSSTTVSLAWAANGNPGGTLYELQRSTGGPFAFQSTGTATSFTDTGLTPQTTYLYQVRAFNEESTATAFSNQVSTVTSPPPAATVSAVIKNPKDGKKIHGNHVAVKAELVLGTAAQTQNVLFQYKDSTSSVWIDIVAAGNDQNPDPSAPYAISWDLTLLPPGTYNLRAVATSLTGTVDPSPQTVTIIDDPSGPNQQNLSANGDELRSQTINNGEGDDIVIGVESNEFITVVVPAGAVNVGTATITVKLPARGSMSAAAAVQDASEIFYAEVGISFAEPEAALAPGQAMILTFSYDDGSAAGVLDWTTSRTGPPALYSYEAASASWRRESASGIDSNSRTVSALISHTGVFALRTPAAAATAAADLSQVRVYPMPYKPNGGDPDHGARFDPGDPNSGIIFDNLPQTTTIKIYTVAGQLVTSFDSNSPNGRIQWDARNGSGRDVASGFYLAVISSPGQPARTKRMLIIR